MLWSVEGLTEARAALASSSPALEGYLRWCAGGGLRLRADVSREGGSVVSG